MRFLLIDQILEYHKGESAIGIKDIAMSEDFLAEHFPRFPVMPGVLQLEAISQLASWLVFVSKDFKMKGTLSELKNIKFKDFVRPGDQLIIEVTFKAMDSEGVTFDAKARVKDKIKTIVNSGRLKFIDIEHLEDPEETREYFHYLTGEKPWGGYSL
ncbi:MAG: beta-hydroxyacyl-ACP dehydratase [Deltaproteobacteria bacterium]|jgi:3-hydroxyacyl-[acyl-carrier-protein] dehydratase|nr:beta-hydroxyacyl-ACP dehydratase [Deltaproteobacteria bacterium]MCK5185764.1 beta-hydroxyacyl-ACP dehydratase [Deltaproteobacteria bacterium]MCK5257440.1 beta-hydroxyacyl-ACP dehydratase [Deltaproteobacteria bacterium]MCK5513985.1 beta-hydroxyacyl-ACP dehydratase [Deltaproteobacteria bacterium]